MLSLEVDVIGPKQQAEILRLFFAEKWRVGTIAKQLNLHHSTVRRVLTRSNAIPAHAPRGSIIDPYVPFIDATLEKYPTLSATRLYEMVRARGYPGAPDHFRHLISRRRPRPAAEAYLRVRTFAGEQAQVDWGHFGKMTLGRASRPLMAFVMVLSFSRMTFLRFYLNAQMPNFLRGHVDAFSHFAGVPRIILYDNLKSAVLERDGDAIRFHPTLLELCKHYRFEPRPVAKARGNEKGRVERKIRHIRTNFMPARKFSDIDDLNAQALSWCTGIAAERPCPEDRSRTVREVFTEDQSALLSLPDTAFDTHERVEVSVRKQPYARYDLNDYSIPHDRIRRTVTVVADLRTVRVLDGPDVIATHMRSFDKGEQVEAAEHIAALRESKRQAKSKSVLDHVLRAVPSASELLKYAAERRASLKRLRTDLQSLLDTYGPEALEAAVAEALVHQTPHIGAVRQLLEIHRREKGQPPPVSIVINNDPRVRHAVVRAHDLYHYDKLTEQDHDNDNES